MIRKFRNYQKL